MTRSYIRLAVLLSIYYSMTEQSWARHTLPTPKTQQQYRGHTSTYYVIIRGGGVASLMTTDDKGEGGIDRTDDVIKTVIL